MIKEKIIIFDLWQTLADSPIKPSDLCSELFPVDNLINRKCFLDKLFSSDLYKKDISLDKGLESFLSDFEINDKEKIKNFISLWRIMIEKSFLINKAENLILDLKNKGYKVCLLTNIDKYGYENFPHKNFLELFDYQFLSYKNNLTKPDIKCWEAVSRHFETDYGNMVMVGDSFENDISPAQNIGVETVIVDISKKEEVYNEIYSRFINN